jgi:hypothetical protein
MTIRYMVAIEGISSKDFARMKGRDKKDFHGRCYTRSMNY